MASLTDLFEIRRSPTGGGPVALVVHSANSAVRQKCSECGKLITLRQGYEGAFGDAEGETATRWIDHIGGFELVFSEKVVSDLKINGMTGFVPHEFPVSTAESKVLSSLPKPNYFLLEVTGKIDLDRQYYDGGDGLLCETCGVWKPRPGGKVRYGDKMTVPLLDTWDGSDFVVCRNIRHGGFFCTARVVELARVKGWTGFEFRGFLPHLPPVNRFNPDWFNEFEEAARAKYPDLE